jgi:glucose-6-phosphate isomerase
VTVRVTAEDQGAYAALVQELVDDKVASRIAAADPTLWGPDAESEAKIRLSWPTLGTSSRPLVEPIMALRDSLKADGVDLVVLAGMGGSSLAPEVITAHAKVPMVALDTTDAGQVRAALQGDLGRTVLVVSSKSGGTVETDSHRRVFEQAFTAAGIDPTKRIVVVTDPGSPLEKSATEAGYRVFLADPHVGGRYSALTAFGLVPAGLAGVDIGALLDEADAVADTFSSDIAENPALHLGAMIGLAHNSGGRDKLVFADNGSGIPGFGDWAEQLIAESTGKLGKGVLPVVTESMTAVGFVNAGDDAVQIVIGPDAATSTPFSAAIEKSLGGQMLLWEYAVAIAGRIIGIDPFDQPNVEEAKAQTRTLLDTPSAEAAPVDLVVDGIEFTGFNVDLTGVDSVVGAIDALLAAAPARGYIAVQAYLDRHQDASADDLRPALAHRSGLQTTFGWGPRFLHSTGQYHKGGHPNGVFLQITGAVSEDLAVPDRPYTFASLQTAQAAGDAAVLAGKGRPVLHVHLTDRAAGLGHLLDVL